MQVELARQDNMLRNQNDRLKLQDITAIKSSDESSEVQILHLFLIVRLQRDIFSTYTT